MVSSFGWPGRETWQETEYGSCCLCERRSCLLHARRPAAWTAFV